MGYLYIANVSRQRQIVNYRLDVDRKGIYQERMRLQAPRQEILAPGKQSIVGGDLGPEQIAQIIEQLEVYGLVGQVDVPNNLHGVAELVFNIDVPVSKHTLEVVHAHNMGMKIEEGTLRRHRAAIAANQALVRESGEIPPVFDVEFEQEEVSEMGEKSITEGFHVVPNPGPQAPTPRKKVA